MNISSLQPLNTKYMRIAYATIIASILLLATIGPALLIAASDDDDNEVGSQVIYEITATNARLNRRVLGPVTASVDGVPAIP